MFVIPSLALVLGLSIFPQNVLAAGAEEERLRGFAEHQDENKQFDKARQQGERGFLEEAERWENQRERDLEQEKHRKKEAEMTEESPEARADAAEKKQTNLVYEENRKNYLKNKSKEEELSREDKKLPSEAQELGLNIERPRYEYRKRAQFGGKSPSEKTASASRTGKSSSGGGNFPPPPTFDDFSRGGGSANGGYVPPPAFPDDFGDIPPPPPPPPPPAFGDDGFGAPGGFNPDFPPPPPPPPFGDDGFGGEF